MKLLQSFCRGRRVARAFAVGFACSFVSTVCAAQVLVEEIQVEPSPESTRVVVELSGPTEYELFTLPDPRRVVLDLKNTRLSAEVPQPATAGQIISRIREARRNEEDWRMVIDVNRPVRATSVFVERDESLGDRLVIDIGPSRFRESSESRIIEPDLAPSPSAETAVIEPILPPTPSAEPAAGETTPATETGETLKSEVTEPPEASQSVTVRPPPTDEEDASATEGMWATLRDGELSGFIGVEGRYFTQDSVFSGQREHNAALTVQPEYYTAWDDDRQSFTFVPYYLLDSADAERTHWDIREMLWQKVGDTWELRAGVGKVFWGVTEAVHVVDIINQTDLVVNVDTEDKLGQPMLNLALVRDWGTVDLFYLPRFRERTFPGRKGRLRTALPVDTDEADYDSGSEKWHPDFAARWSHTVGAWDIGFSHFYGTSREPRLRAKLDDSGRPILFPKYDIINQTGLDVQATVDAWLLKLEAISRSGQGRHFTAVDAGFEYTITGMLDTNADLGVLAEYLFDSREDDVEMPFDDDIFVAFRFTPNDVQSTELLAGMIFDRTDDDKVFNVEASRRVGDNWRVEFEARLWQNIDSSDPLSSIRDDDYLQLSIMRFF